MKYLISHNNNKNKFQLTFKILKFINNIIIHNEINSRI